jgi:Secretion system C-terminal sorting domain
MKKKSFLLFSLMLIIFASNGQTDTISTNIYQNQGRMGIGTQTPEFLLHLSGDADHNTLLQRKFIRLHNINNSDHSHVSINLMSGTGSNTAWGSFGVCAYSNMVFPHLQSFSYLYSKYSGIALRAVGADGKINFFVGGDTPSFERMAINNVGNIGIATADPQARLHVCDGDIFIDDIEKGIIMKSPDGRCWRGTVNNMGNLIFVVIDCPGDTTANVMQQTSEINLDIFPNPAEDIITVSCSGQKSFKSVFRIFDINGKIQKKGKITSNMQEIDISDMPNATYILHLYKRNGDFLSSTKFVKM